MMVSNAQRERAAVILGERLGLLFPPNRAADLERALTRVMRAHGASDVDALLDWLATLPRDSSDLARVAGFFTTGETYFFRNAAYFEALERVLLPQLIAARRASGSRWLRFWSAGCATGEEPYSLAIVLDRLLPDLDEWAVTILATDVSAEALHRARQGVYRRWSLRETPEAVSHRYFRAQPTGSFQLADRIRRLVTFQILNLAADGYPALETNTVAMDLVVCRNVLMYLTPSAQRDVFTRLQEALVPGGWLMVAPAESPAESLPGFRVVTFPDAAFYEREGPSGPVPFRAQDLNEGDATDTDGRASGVAVRSTVAPPIVIPRPRPVSSRMPRADAPRTPVSGRTAGPSPIDAARSLADRGQLEEASALCERRLDEDPLDGHAYLLLGSICHERGENERAIAALRKCLYLMPGSVAAHFLLAGLLQREANHEQARRAFETVIALLEGVPSDRVLEDVGGLTAGRVVALARSQAASVPRTARARRARTGDGQ